ncbi:SHOCT domain-containing protein [Fusibacter ferrireducens]|uniref:SHOCT domain-containing protein n=1 Tax=Fusibacter ferrireducens TaxID=2785058 RepID=A0ABR9ZRS2_9FIRM|nr:hypothetical protein [Fusibacter ferrireducens]MBF4692625.1 hypothetical protein [Fusibacter ferrireducens]
MMFLFTIGIIAIVYYFYQHHEVQSVHRVHNQSEDTPEVILSKRYVMGEIDSETYENMKNVMKR